MTLEMRDTVGTHNCQTVPLKPHPSKHDSIEPFKIEASRE